MPSGDATWYVCTRSAHHAACAQAGLNGLIASFGLALIERAITDALGRLERAPGVELVRANRLGLSAATASDLAGFNFDAFLASLAPALSICARHTSQPPWAMSSRPRSQAVPASCW